MEEKGNTQGIVDSDKVMAELAKRNTDPATQNMEGPVINLGDGGQEAVVSAPTINLGDNTEPKQTASTAVEEQKADDKPQGSTDKVEQPATTHTLTEETVFKKLFIGFLQRKGLDPSTVEFEGEDGDKVTFDDLKIESEEDYLDIVETVTSSETEDRFKDTVNKNELSDFTRELIEAEKSGANPFELLQHRQKVVGDIDKYDITNKEDGLKIIAHYLSLTNLSDKDQKEFLTVFSSKSDEEIRDKADEYRTELHNVDENHRKQKIKEAEAKAIADAEALKKRKKEVRAGLSKGFELNDNTIAKILDFGYKDNGNNQPEALIKFQEMMNDVSKAPELLMYLYNPDEFVMQKAQKKINENTSKVYKKIFVKKTDKGGGNGADTIKKDEKPKEISLR